MTVPQRRRPLPAVILVAVLTVVTAIVWVRVIGNADSSDASSSPTPCRTPSPTLPTTIPFSNQVSLIVLNSTNRPDLAAHTKTDLEKRNFKVTTVGNDGPSYGGHGIIEGVAEIRFGPAGAAAATVVHYFLPNATLVRTDSSSATVVLSLGAKFHGVPTRDDAEALMRRHHIARSSASPEPVPVPVADC